MTERTGCQLYEGELEGLFEECCHVCNLGCRFGDTLFEFNRILCNTEIDTDDVDFEAAWVSDCEFAGSHSDVKSGA